MATQTFSEMVGQVARDISEATADALRQAREWVGESAGRPAGGEFSLPIALEGATTLRLEMGPGQLDVASGEGPDVLLTATGFSQEDLVMDRQGAMLLVRRKHAAGFPWLGTSRVTVALPAGVTRFEARADAGDVTVRGLQVQTDLSVGAGNLRVSRSRLEGSVECGMGNVNLEAVGGNLEARTHAGNIAVQAPEGGRFELRTGAGNITVQEGRLDSLSARTGAGEIKLALPLSGGEYQCRSGAGTIRVDLPADSAVQVEAVTGMGQVHSDWPLVRVGRPGPAVAGSVRMVGAFGDEGRRSRLELHTGLGEIRLRRRGGKVPTELIAAAPPAGRGTELEAAAPPAGTEPEAAAPPQAPADESARLAILESLARGEITVEEADWLLAAGKGE